MAGEWGHFAIDDKARPAGHNVLIQDGVLTTTCGTSSGPARRVVCPRKRPPPEPGTSMVRMTNTYIAAGHDDPEAIIADTDSGVYVAQLGGGQVNTATGDFVSGMTEAYLIGTARSPTRSVRAI